MSVTQGRHLSTKLCPGLKCYYHRGVINSDMFPSYGASFVTSSQWMLSAFVSPLRIASSSSCGTMATETLLAADCQMHNASLPYQNGGPVWNPTGDCQEYNANIMHGNTAVKPPSVAGTASAFMEKDISNMADVPLKGKRKESGHREGKEILDLMDRMLNTANTTNNNNNDVMNHNDMVKSNRLSQGSRASTASTSSMDSTYLPGTRSTLDIQRKLGTPGSVSPLLSNSGETLSMSRPQMVAREIVVTERSYVHDLGEVISGYLLYMYEHGIMSADIETIFCNLEDIYNFNKGLLQELETCGNDPVIAAQCFVDKGQGFNSLYVPYCTNYPEASAFLSEVLKDREAIDFFLERQKLIGHALPLESYLLKPVQRILKYHLLLEDIARHYKGNEDGEKVIQASVVVMTDVAEYINEMKRLQEDAIKAQEVLSQISDLAVNDVFATGKLVLENSFRLHGTRGDRYLFLFAKKLLFCKKLEEGQYKFLDSIDCSNMMLVESLPKDPMLSFQVIRFDNQKINFTIQAKNPEIKREWIQELKRLILENHSALIPSTARQAILGPRELNRSKYDSMQFEALDDTKLANKIHLRRQKSLSGKENRASQLAGIKRDNILKGEDADLGSKKGGTNGKAKDHPEKKGKHTNSPLPADKTRPWRFKKQKHPKISIEKMFEGMHTLTSLQSPDESMTSPPPAVKLIKSRSLESLRDVFQPEGEEISEPTSQETESPPKPDEPVRRLSLNIVSLDAKKEDVIAKPDSPVNENEEEAVADDSLTYPTNESVMRRAQDYEAKHLRQVSQSMFFDNFKSQEQASTLPRARPTSMPPVDDPRVPRRHLTFDETKRMFGVADARISRGSTDLRKFGLSDIDIKKRLDSETSNGSVFDRRYSTDNSSIASGCERSDDGLDPTRESGEDEELDSNFQKLEKRLSMLSDDDTSSTSIKNTIRKVSQAFSSHAVDSSRNCSLRDSDSMSDIANEISAALGSSSTSGKERHRKRNTGSFGSAGEITEEASEIAEAEGGENVEMEEPSQEETKPATVEEIYISSVSVISDANDTKAESEGPVLNSLQSTEEIYKTLDESCKALDEIQKSLNRYQEAKMKESQVILASSRRGSAVAQLKSGSAVSVTLAPKHSKSVFERAREYAAMMQENTEVKRDKGRYNRAKFRRWRTVDGSAADSEDGGEEDSVTSPVVIRLERAASVELGENNAQKQAFSFSSKDFLNEAEIINTYHGHVVVKPVADRILDYQRLTSGNKCSTLPSRRKATVDEMLESLESIPNTSSEIYNTQRRKYNSLRTRSATPDDSLDFDSCSNLLMSKASEEPVCLHSAMSFEETASKVYAASSVTSAGDEPGDNLRSAPVPLTSGKKITVIRPGSIRNGAGTGRGDETRTERQKRLCDLSTTGNEDSTVVRNVVKFRTNVRMQSKSENGREAMPHKVEVTNDTMTKVSQAGDVQFSINFELADKSSRPKSVSTTFTSQVNATATQHGNQTSRILSADLPPTHRNISPSGSPATRRKVTSFTSSSSPQQGRRRVMNGKAINAPEPIVAVKPALLNESEIDEGLALSSEDPLGDEESNLHKLKLSRFTSESRSPSLRNIEKFIVRKRVEDILKSFEIHQDEGEEDSDKAIFDNSKREVRSAVRRRRHRSNDRMLKARSLVEDVSIVYEEESPLDDVTSQGLGKLQRSSSCEQLQRGTVRQLIGVFNT